MTEHELWIDAKPVAKYLGVTRAYVLKLALLGKIPACSLPAVGGTGKRVRWRFRMSEIEAWVKAQRGRNGRR